MVRERIHQNALVHDAGSAAGRWARQHLRLTIPLLEELHRKGAAATREGPSTQDLKLAHRALASLTGAYLFTDVFADGDHLTASFSQVATRVAHSIKDPLLRDFAEREDWSNVGLVGFSLLTEFQLPYAMALASMLRSDYPGLRTVAGGAYVTELIQGLVSDPDIFTHFDFLVCHEGESALASIVSDGDRTDHPNVYHSKRHYSKHHGFIIEDINSLPPQDFSQFQLDLYRPWGLSLPLYSSKGCTWGRCAFCSVNYLRYRERDVHRFWQSVVQVIKATGVTTLQLVDEDVRPERLRQLADLALTSGGPRAEWLVQTRFYPGLEHDLLSQLAESGFSTIEFGLESVNSRTLRRVKKGISMKVVERVLADCEACGIQVILNFMVGFPWEDEQDGIEAIKYVETLQQRHPNLDLTCNTQPVKVYVHSEFHRSSEMFDIHDSSAVPLSPVAVWQNPDWLPSFQRRYKDHLLLSGCSSRQSGKVEAIDSTKPEPNVKLAPYWYFLPAKSDDVFSEEQARPLLVKEVSGTYEVFAVNETLEGFLFALGEGCNFPELKKRFLDRYLDRDGVLSAWESAVVKLNEMRALAFDEQAAIH